MIQVEEYLNGRVLSGNKEDVILFLPGQVPGKRLLILAGAHVFNNKVLKKQIDDLFRDREVSWEVVVRHPMASRIEAFIQEVVRRYNPDAILAIGGGSVIDTAKIVSVVAPNVGLMVEDVMHGRFGQAKGKTFLAVISTLAGSGSEVTPFATVFHESAKYSVDHLLVQPNITVVLPHLGLLPPVLPAAAAYLDVWVQSIESLWAVRGTEESQQHAWAALEHLAEYRKEGLPGKQLKLLAEASVIGGKAIGISRTTLAHALSYWLTGRHEVPHGIACAIFLPEVLLWNARVSNDDCAHPRGGAWVRRQVELVSRRISGRPEPEAAVQVIRNIAREVHVPLSLATYGISTDEQYANLVSRVGNPDRVGNNPRRVTREAITAIVAQTATYKD